MANNNGSRQPEVQAMMDDQLNTWLLFDHAEKHHGDTEVVSKLASGAVHRYTYRDFSHRAQQLMHALDGLGLDPGARVATFAWNSYRHLEAYFGIPCSGRVIHTLNVRLSPDELAYIIGHADDRAILVDAELLPALEAVGEGLAKVEHIIVMGDAMLKTSLRNAVLYEDLLASQPTSYPRVDIPERTLSGICYTSGTTGRPKGAAYTHRSTFLHAMAMASPAGFSFGIGDAILPIVPMFHANAWGAPYAAVAYGAKLVFSGPHLDPATVVDLLEDEKITVACGVPTIWLMVADELRARGRKPSALRHICSGGAQPPRALIERYLRDYGIPIIQAWGMTETSPLASQAWPKHLMRDWDEDDVTERARTRAGIPIPGINVSIRDLDNNEVPWDGETMGDLVVRGPWVIGSYLHGDGAEQFTPDGWFKTGDVAIGSANGYFVIADRTKDLIKSGGEWISSVDMEGAIMAMPGVAEAAVIAIPDPKWLERPLACVVPRPGETVSSDAVRAHLLAAGFAHWQLPDRVEVIDAVPRTTVGKFDKKVLRARFPH
ncbi:MAG: long-chain fatty acid--CoA ligase [Candidatus Dormibacteria bacterium]